MVCSLFDSTSAVLRMAETLGKPKKHCEIQLNRYNRRMLRRALTVNPDIACASFGRSNRIDQSIGLASS